MYIVSEKGRGSQQQPSAPEPAMPPELQPIKRTGKTHVPVRSVTKAAAIDDLGIATVSSKLYRDLLEMLDDRHGHGATLIP